jgi:hypothetical protein
LRGSIRRPVVLVGEVILLAIAACSGTVEDPAGPLRLDGGFAVSQADVDPGETWSAGSISLCIEDPKAPATLLAIEPVRVVGQVAVEGIGVRITRWGDPEGPSDVDTHMVGLHPGVPSGLLAPRDFFVDTSCPSSNDPVGEIVVTLRKTGDAGGMLDDLLVTYRADGETHRVRLAFGFALCGPRPEFDGLCGSSP